MIRLLRLALTGLAAAAIACAPSTGALARWAGPVAHAAPAGATTAVPGIQRPHPINARPSAPAYAGSANDMVTGGGRVLHTPHVYLDFWGAQWAQNVPAGASHTTPGLTYDTNTAMTYVTDFFKGMGGSAWNNVNSQYCDGVPAGTKFCAGKTGATFIQNNTDVYHGTWLDSSTLPPFVPDGNPVDTGLYLDKEAVAASEHFGYDSQALIFLYLPPFTATIGFGYYCAYHSNTADAQGRDIAYAVMPFVPTIPTVSSPVITASCGGNFVNKTDDAYGHGYFDGLSVVSAHEYAEAVTDPDPNSAWNAPNGETGDVCADIATGQGAEANEPFGNQYFAVQSIWSNNFNNGRGGCVQSYP